MAATITIHDALSILEEKYPGKQFCAYGNGISWHHFLPEEDEGLADYVVNRKTGEARILSTFGCSADGINEDTGNDWMKIEDAINQF